MGIFVRQKYRHRMRIVFFMMAVILGGMKAAAQNITISEKNVSIEVILKKIRAQTGFNYVCKEDWVKQIGPVSVDLKNAPFTLAIDKCLAGKPFQYQIMNTTITIFPAAEKPVEPQATLNVSGTVVNKQNKALDGASVVVQRNKQGCITDSRGRFTLKNILPDDVLTITFLGYTAQQVGVSGQTDISVVMDGASSQLDEVILQGYTKSNERFITGNITKITAKDIEKQPVMNPLLALEGRVPGLVVTPTSGFASAPVKMEIRGLNSLNTSIPADPLYVINGVPLTILSLGNSTNRISNGFIQSVGFNYPSGGTTGGQSPLFSINPKDIESIEVLKDADATAVYGSRGSNGVILITTKKGKPGRIRFEFDFNPPALSWGSASRRIKLLNTQEYLQMRREALKNDGLTPNIVNAPDLVLWDTTRYTDWQKSLLGNRVTNIDITTGVTGGTEQINLRLSANYNRLTNSNSISGATERITVANFLQLATPDQKFSATLSANFSYIYVNVVQPVGNPFLAPNAPPIYDSNGNPNWAEWNANGLLNLYPFGRNLSPANPQSTTTLTSALRMEYKPYRGLVFSLDLGYNFAHNATETYYTIASQNPYQQNLKGSVNFSTTHNNGWYVKPQITYSRRIGKGDMQLTLVGTEQTTATNGINLYGENYENDILLKSINNAGVVYTSTASAKEKNASFIGGINYNWDHKYIINLNGTRQGSSKFGPDNKYGSFWSVGAAWLASEEKWIARMLPSFVSFLKVRGSYGLTGSDGLSDYQYLALWRVQNYASAGGYNGQMTFTPTVRPNQRYRWENNHKLEGAVNVGLLDDRFTFNLSLYRNRVSNQLVSYPTPSYINGAEISSIITNIPMLLQNSGWEGSLNAQLIKNRHFSLATRLVVSANRNILIDFPNIEQTPYFGQYAVGQSVNSYYLFHYLGADPMTGLPAFKDYNKDGIVSSNGQVMPTPGSDDRGVYVDLQPQLEGGWGFSGNYKKLQFSIYFAFKQQQGPSFYYYNAVQAGQLNQNLPYSASIIQRWRKPGDIASYPVSTTTIPVTNVTLGTSDFAFSDASYIRISNLYLSYPLPEAWGKKIKLKDLAVSLSAQNLLTFSRYKGGIEPQLMSLSGIPTARLYTVKFSYHF